ncbi:hypothetical protein PAECIP111893_04038 [Paenibacillus plantiphilus]|uniref:Uncharacterized protein n=1 Tax=Paenibacillus plantiphilus TaxID=2905650 RepID=A0ABN8GYS1_9BACL|nr:hypothetical protein [Paenibacillus plantiphilus]CAH1215832.1 hypothetical protein PAECIP111893_04038 [Paenibacillus plantiphilus]
MNKTTLILLFIIVILLVGNVYQGVTINDHKYIQKIDSQFIASLARMSGGFEEGEKVSFLAVEHVFKAVTLSQFASYKKTNIYLDSYISVLATTIREKYLNEQVIINAKEIQQLIMELSEDPTNQTTADKLTLLIKG